MKETTVQIDGMMSIFDGAGVEKQIKRHDGVLRVDANFLNGTATVVYDEARVNAGDIIALVAEGNSWPSFDMLESKRPCADIAVW